MLTSSETLTPIPGRDQPNPNVDPRSDGEILDELANPPKVSSECNIWAWWDTGLRHMSPWCQRNVIGWVRMHGPSWTVRILDNNKDSKSYWRNFLSNSDLPKCLVEGTLHGKHARTLSSDMVRLPCLTQHGGVWLDVGIILLRSIPDLCWKKLADPASSYALALISNNEASPWTHFGNFFIAAPKNNPFLRRWMLVYKEAWRDRNTCEGLGTHGLFRQGTEAEATGTTSTHSLDYFGHMLALNRVLLLQDPNDGFSGQSYAKNHILLFKYNECAAANMLTNNDGAKQFKLLSHTCQPDDNAQCILANHQEAEMFTHRLLTETSTIKLYHRRLNDGDSQTLAELWDLPQNQNADNAPGSFARYLRNHSVRFSQKRLVAPAKFVARTDREIVAGLLEDDEED